MQATCCTAQPDVGLDIASLQQELALERSRFADKDAELQQLTQMMSLLWKESQQEIAALKEQLNESSEQAVVHCGRNESASSLASPSIKEHEVSF